MGKDQKKMEDDGGYLWPILFLFQKLYHLVIEHGHGKSLINGGFHGKIIYKWAMFHGYVK
jgi:hypothetical protein